MGIHAQPVFSRHAAEASFWRSVQAPTSSSVADELRAALELARPGFMAFTAMREGERIVDFVWSFASSAAGRILGRNALDLYGKHLRVVLAGEDCCETLFQQYRRVVEHGVASATQVHQINGRHDTYRHGAVRVGDGVAATLINLSAAHRAQALALHARYAVGIDEPSRISWKSI
jgi:hypothetical protein